MRSSKDRQKTCEGRQHTETTSTQPHQDSSFQTSTLSMVDICGQCHIKGVPLFPLMPRAPYSHCCGHVTSHQPTPIQRWRLEGGTRADKRRAALSSRPPFSPTCSRPACACWVSLICNQHKLGKLFVCVPSLLRKQTFPPGNAKN